MGGDERDTILTKGEMLLSPQEKVHRNKNGELVEQEIPMGQEAHLY